MHVNRGLFLMLVFNISLSLRLSLLNFESLITDVTC